MQNHIRRFSSSSSSPRLNKWCVITDNHGLSLSFRVNKKKEEEEKKKNLRGIGIWSSSSLSAHPLRPPPSSYTLIRPPPSEKRRIDGFPYTHTHTHTYSTSVQCVRDRWYHTDSQKGKKKGKKKKHLCVRALYTHISVRIDLMSRAFFSLSLPFNTRRCMQESESKAYTSLERNEEKIIIK